MPLSVYMHAIQPMIYHLMQKWFPWKQAPTLKIDHLMHSKVPWQVWHHMKAQRSSRSHPFHQNSIRQMFPEINTRLLLRLQTFWCSELLHLTENSIHFKRLNKHSHFYAGHIEASIMLLRQALCFYDTQEEFIPIHLLNSKSRISPLKPPDFWLYA